MKKDEVKGVIKNVSENFNICIEYYNSGRYDIALAFYKANMKSLENIVYADNVKDIDPNDYRNAKKVYNRGRAIYRMIKDTIDEKNNSLTK